MKIHNYSDGLQTKTFLPMKEVSMQNTSLNCDNVHEGHLVRIGGLAVVLGLTIHIVVNVVLKEFPVENLTLPELRAYLLINLILGRSFMVCVT